MEFEQYRAIENHYLSTMWFLNLAWLNDTAEAKDNTIVSWLPQPRHNSGGLTFPGEKLINPDAYSVFNEADGFWHIKELGLHCFAVKVDRVCKLGVHVEGSPRHIPEILKSHLVHDRLRIRDTIERVWTESSAKTSLVSLLEFLFESGEEPTSRKIYEDCEFLYQVLFNDATETTLQNKGHVRDAICCVFMLLLSEFEQVGESPTSDELVAFGDTFGSPGVSNTVTLEPLKASEVVSNHFHDEWVRSSKSDMKRLEDFLEQMSERWETTDDERRKELLLMVIDSLRRTFLNCYVTRTEKGYTTMLPLHAKIGDGIWLLKNYDRPVVLRSKGDSYVFVGNCGLFNVFEREPDPLKDTVQALRNRVQEIRIE